MRISKEPEIRKQEIVSTAQRLFEKQGIRKTTVTQIADELSIAKGLIYYYFRSKDELIDAIIDSFSLEVSSRLETAIQAKTATDRLSGIFHVYFQIIKSHPILLNLNSCDPSLLSLIKERLSEIACQFALEALNDAVQSNALNIAYPEHMLHVLIYGLGDLYLDGVRDPAIHAAVIEQALGLKRSTLLSFQDDSFR